MRAKTFEEHWKENRKALYSWAYRLTKDHDNAEDLLSECAFRAFRAFERFAPTESFLNWGYRILTNRYLDKKRHDRRRIKAMLMEDWRPPESPDVRLEDVIGDWDPNPLEAVELEEILDTLPLNQRRFFKAHAEGLSYGEIAEKFGKPVGTVRSRFHRYRKAARKDLEAAGILP